MKYLIPILLILLSGCSKHYTNEQCVKEVCKAMSCDSYDRQDRAFAEIGASVKCGENDNNPKKVLRVLEK